MLSTGDLNNGCSVTIESLSIPVSLTVRSVDPVTMRFPSGWNRTQMMLVLCMFARVTDRLVMTLSLPDILCC